MKSSQTDWPYCCRAATRVGHRRRDAIEAAHARLLRGPRGPRLLLAVTLLHGLDLGEAAHVPLLAGERAPRRRPRTSSWASAGPTMRPPSTSTFMSSCSTPWWAEYESWQMAARMPGILLAATEAPTPLPQMRTPRSARPVHHGLAHRLGEVGIVDGRRGVGAHVDHLVAVLAQHAARSCLSDEARVVGARRRSSSQAFRAELLLGRGHHVLGVEAELLLQVLERRRGAEGAACR